MTAKQNKEIVRTVVEEGWNKGNLSVLDDIIADDYVFRVPGNMEFKGSKGLKSAITMYRTAFPDFQIKIDELIAEENKVVGCFTFGGTFKNELMGIPPTGKSFTNKGAVVVSISGGKEIEALEFADQLSMFQQLGIKPPGI